MMLLALVFVLKLHAQTFFPADYEESRQRFRNGASESAALGGGFRRAFLIPSAKYDDLYVDAAYFSRGGRRLVVLTSGTHGPETYAGAAVQEMARQRHLETLLDAGIDVLMIHALNPFGFRENRRVDENNVNLNRNFLLEGQTYDIPNPQYDARRGLFERECPVGHARASYAGVDFNLLWALGGQVLRNLPSFRLAKAVRPISEGMNSGQYVNARGLNFGGFGPSAQVGIVRDLLTPLIAQHDETIYFDLHTGLGDADVLHLMLAKASAPEMVGAWKEPLARLAPAKIKTTVVAEDDGFFRTTGDEIEFVASLARPGHRVMAVTAEFGTMGTSIPAQLRSAHRMIVENQAWFNGCRDALTCGQVRRDFIDLFNPPAVAWRTHVIDQADRLLRAVRDSFR